MPKKQSDGRYRAKITIGHTADGKAVTKYVSAASKRELEDAKAAARAYYVDGAERREDMLFCEYAKAWYAAKKEPHLSESSRVGYLVHLNKHMIPIFGNRMLRSIQPLELQIWLNSYAGKSKTAITMLISISKGIFRSAYAEGILQRDPSVSLIRPKPRQVEERRALTPEEKQKIEATIWRHEHGAMLGVMYYLGVRRGEALGLQWGDFDWAQGLVHIQRDIDYTGGSKGVVDDLKTRAADRVVPIPAQLRDLLASVRGLPHVFLFGAKDNNPLPYSTYQRRWVNLMIDAGLAQRVEREPEKDQVKNGEEKKKRRTDVRFDWECEITPHYLRHNYATMLYDAGVDPLVAMRILGHSDYATTAKIYTHLNNMHIENAKTQIEKMAFGKKVAEKLPR